MLTRSQPPERQGSVAERTHEAASAVRKIRHSRGELEEELESPVEVGAGQRALAVIGGARYTRRSRADIQRDLDALRVAEQDARAALGRARVRAENEIVGEVRQHFQALDSRARRYLEALAEIGRDARKLRMHVRELGISDAHPLMGEFRRFERWIP